MEFDEAYLYPFERNFDERCSEKITADVCTQLKNTGYVVVDNFLGFEWASVLRQEIEWLQRKDFMSPNKTQFNLPNGERAQFTKPHIFEVDLHDTALRQKVPELNALFSYEHLINRLQVYWPSLIHGTNGRTLKLQYNEGKGGCFPFHYDNPGVPNKRQITCLLYLNPNWQEGDGGEIQFQPFLGKKVTFAPIMDRLILFKSDAMLHRVLPTKAERYCLTIWLDGDNVNSKKDTLLTTKLLKNWFDFVETLKHSALQRVVSRGVYADEYLESLTDCMQHSEGYTHMLKSHEDYMESISELKNPIMHQIISKLVEYREIS